MSYQAKNIDPEKFKEHIRDLRSLQMQKKEETIKEAEARCAGYMQALTEVSSMLTCSNYEMDGSAADAIRAAQYEALFSLAESLRIEPRFTAENTLSEMVSILSEDIIKSLPRLRGMGATDNKEAPEPPPSIKEGPVYCIYDGVRNNKYPNEDSRYIRSALPKTALQDYVVGLMFYIEEHTEYGSEASVSEDVCAYLLTHFFGCVPATREEWEDQEAYQCSEPGGPRDFNACGEYNIELFSSREDRCGPDCDEYQKPIGNLKDTDFMKALLAYFNSECCLRVDMTAEQILRNYGAAAQQ